MRFFSALLASVALPIALFSVAGCGCHGVICGPCAPPGIYVSVIDVATMEPIADAVVTAAGTACPRDSLSPGYFCDMPPGTYTVEVSAPGHVAQTITVVLPEDDEESCCSCGSRTNAKVVLEVM